MDDDVVIVEVKPKMFDVRNKSGKCTFRLCYKKDVYVVNQPITHKPEYLAIREPGGIFVEMLFMIDQAKSMFEKGLIVPQGKPTKVSIPLRMDNEIPTNHISLVYFFPNTANSQGNRRVYGRIFQTDFKCDSNR